MCVSFMFCHLFQIDVLQAEVTALKTLVLTSTPSSPNRQLHPQLQSPGTRGAYKHVGGHIRNKSASGALPSLPGKPEPSSVSIQPPVKEDREVLGCSFAKLSVFISASANLDLSIAYSSFCSLVLFFTLFLFILFLSTNPQLTCSSRLMSLLLSACCSCSPFSDSLPCSWTVCQYDL